MDSSCSTPSSSRSRVAAASRLPHHLQQPSSSTSGERPAVHSPSVHNVRPGQSYVTVQTLSKENLVIVVNAKTRVHDVLWACGETLEIAEDKLFGLALRQPTEGIGGDQPRHEYFFLDPAQKIFKYTPKQPRFSNWHNRSSENRPLLVLYLRVRVYIDQVRLITCSRALEHYYMQLKDNFLDQWSGSHSVSEERCWEMAALALKADKGENQGGYFRAEQYFPMWVIDIRGLEYIRKFMPAASEDLKDISRIEAMTKFCLEASRFPFALNCHLYGLRRHKMDSVDNAVLGINAKGIEMCDIGDDGERIPLRDLAWSKVTRLSFDRKKLSITGSDGTKMSLYALSESKARYLLELCRAVHQTLLVLSHQTARIAPLPQPFVEKSVDRTSTSSVTASPAIEHDTESLLHESTTNERCYGSVSSKSRIRVKLDSNLELKIEKMELESIRQERAASQSSKASESSDLQKDLHDDTPSSSDSYLPCEQMNIRPSSVDSASQTVESGSGGPRSAGVDVNFNSKLDLSDQSLMESFSANMNYGNISFLPDLQYASSGGSRSDSVQQSHEMLPEVMMHHSYHHDQGFARSEDDADSTLRSNLPPLASISLHDLRPSGSQLPRYMDVPEQHMQRTPSPSGKPRWTTVGVVPTVDAQPSTSLAAGQARSEPKIDSDLWSHPSVSAALQDGPSPSRGRLFTKRANSAVNRMAGTTINRVHSMPAQYHMLNGYARSSPSEDYVQATPSLQHAQSMNATRPKSRDPPPYDRAVAAQQAAIHSNGVHGVPSTAAPQAAEIPSGQAAFPPASATGAQFQNKVDNQYYMEDEALSTDRLRDFPLMQRLWRESHGMLSHQRRPSSCNDLSDYVNVNTIQPIHILQGNINQRSDYFHDTTNLAYTQSKPSNNTANGYGFRSPNSAVVLPPPPPYPASRKAPLVM